MDTRLWVVEVPTGYERYAGTPKDQEYNFKANGLWAGVSNGVADRSVIVRGDGSLAHGWTVSGGETVEVNWSGWGDPVSGLSADVSGGETTLILSWSLPVAGERADIVKYRIYRSTDSRDTGYGMLVEIDASSGTTSYIDSGLETGETYYYRIASVDTRSSGETEGRYSSRLEGVPVPPVDVTFVVDMSGIFPDTVYIAGPFNGFSPGANDVLSDMGGGRWGIVKSVAVGSLFEYKFLYEKGGSGQVWEDGKLEQLVEYYEGGSTLPYKVTVAGDFNGWDGANGVLMRQVDTRLWVVEVPTGYERYAGTPKDQGYKFLLEGQWTDGGNLTGDRSVIVRSDGSMAHGWTVSGGETVVVDWGGYPDPVTGLSVSPGDTSGKLDLSWSLPASGEQGDIVGYRIYRSTDSRDTGYEAVATVGAGVTTYSDSGLEIGETYYYRIASVDTGMSGETEG
ncbi:MAG: fibronectin type III domain-containing protein, partial [Acidobacteriota bacterium]|nr:fibronectin type III domain-containing protein [Acidobacteriota bacterium]